MLKTTALLLLLASIASAAEIKEWETVFEQDAWRLDVNIWDDGSLSCETRSVSEQGTLFSVESWPDGAFSISMYNESWQFPAESVPLTFVIRIDDGTDWNIDGEKFDSTVFSYLDRTQPATQQFLTAFYNGAILMVESTKGSPIARFELAGTGPTMVEHSKCEDRIGSASATIEVDPSAKLAKETF